MKFPSEIEVEAEEYRRDFYQFFKRAWIELEGELQENWHLELICSRLEKIKTGEIQNLVICIPPGMGKSLTISVVFPAWLWLDDPSLEFQVLSGNEEVQTRDSRRMRDLIQCEWYVEFQKALHGEFYLRSDQNQKTNFGNNLDGERKSAPINGRITGKRGDLQTCDDPYDVSEAMEGSAERIENRMEKVVEKWDNQLPSRLNDEENNPRILIQHRVHPRDLAGQLIERGWDSLVLPMEFDPEHPHADPDDPREEEGELLFPERFSKELVGERKQTYLASQWSAQYNQRPQTREGTIVQEEWFGRWNTLPKDDSELCWLQSWDLRAGGDGKKSSYAVGQLWAGDWETRAIYLVDQIRGKWDISEEFERIIDRVKDREMFPRWTQASEVLIEEEADGKAIIPVIEEDIPGIEAVQPGSSSKEARLRSVVPQIKSGFVYIPSVERGHYWVDDYLLEITNFPGTTHDDQVDTTSQVLRHWKLSSASSTETTENVPPLGPAA